MSILDRDDDFGDHRGPGPGRTGVDPGHRGDGGWGEPSWDDENGDPYLDWDDEDDFVRVRPAGFRYLRAVVAVVILIAIAWLLYSNVRGWFERQLDPLGPPGEAVTVIVPSGATTGDIAEILEGSEVIPNSTFFRYYAQYRGEGNFQAGEYEMQLNSSASEAIETLNAGPIPPVFRDFGVPEGLWVSEMLPRIAEQLPGITETDLRAVLDSDQLEPRYRPDGVDSWEGLLFPAFYEVEDDVSAIEVLDKMSSEFARVTGELGYGAAETQLNLSAYEVIVIASMVQAEAKTEADAPRIARVIYNRLREEWSLDIDATCIYGYRDRGIDLNQVPLRDDPERDDDPGGYACRENAARCRRRRSPPRGASPSKQPSARRPSRGTMSGCSTSWPTPRATTSSPATSTSSTSRRPARRSRGCSEVTAPSAEPAPPTAARPTGATRLAAVIGDPVRHSLSPVIHNAAFAAAGLDWTYVAFEVAAGKGADALGAMATLGIEGLSVTMPHKEAVAAAVDELTPVAAALGACNCVFRRGDRLVGHSTDGDGFVRSLAVDDGVDLAGRRVMVVGTGGAARSIIEAAGRAGAAEVVVVSRSAPSPAVVGLAPAARAGLVEEATDMDIVINATPIGMTGGPDPSGVPVPPHAVAGGQLAVDIVYQPRLTPWLAAAAERGAAVVNGVGMLVHQAAIAFEHWTGTAAPLDAMRSAAVGPSA